MLSQNVAKVTVPSYSHIRTSIPHRQAQFQWQGVFYFSGITKQRQNSILLSRKKAAQKALATLESQSSRLTQRFDAEFAAVAFPQNPDASISSGGTAIRITKPFTIARENAQEWLFFCSELCEHGLVDLASPIADHLHSSKCLSSADYAYLIASCAADKLAASILHSHAQNDPTLVLKLLADRRGADRAALARRLFTMANDVFGASEGAITAIHFNALMKVLLTAGYDAASTVSGSLYDHMGNVGVQPNATTYERVLTSLALQGKISEAEHVLAFLQANCAEHVTIAHYNHLLAGYRESKMYDKCDQLWQEIYDRRWPRANILTAEIYLRSIVDHSYQAMSDPLSKMGNVNVVEKKKVPLVLSQMDELSLPRTLLSPPLLDEVEDALRKYSIYKHRFYEWGRATRQFNFIEYRRRHGWMQDLREMTPSTVQTTPFRSPEDRPDASYAPAAVAEVPSFFADRNTWDQPVLENLLTITSRRERMEDVRSGDFYYDEKKNIHDREVGWMQKNPETRYDQLYGMMNPDIPKIGIRRHLDSEYVNRADVIEKDASIVKKALTGGRRVRQKVEFSRTHRNSASSAGAGQ